MTAATKQERLMSAVRHLRAATGLPQDKFAVEVGISFGTVQKYTNRAAPSHPAQLLLLANCAQKHRRMDLWQIFADAVVEQLPGLDEFVKAYRRPS